jgi:hypothetical protein
MGRERVGVCASCTSWRGLLWRTQPGRVFPSASGDVLHDCVHQQPQGLGSSCSRSVSELDSLLRFQSRGWQAGWLRRSVMRPPKLTVALIVMFLTSAVAMAGCGASAQSGDVRGKQPGGTTSHLANDFAVLRRHGQPATPEVMRMLRLNGGTIEGRHLSTHTVQTSIGPLWIAVVDRRMCLLAGRPLAISCSGASQARRHGVFLGLVEHPNANRARRRFAVYGVVPNSQHAVRMTIGRHTVQVAVHTNSFAIRSTEPIFAL